MAFRTFAVHPVERLFAQCSFDQTRGTGSAGSTARGLFSFIEEAIRIDQLVEKTAWFKNPVF